MNRRRSHRRVDDADESKADARRDQQSTDIVETANGVLPRDTPRVLGREVEREDADEREALGDEAAPVDVLPVVLPGVDGVLQRGKMSADPLVD